MSLPNVEINQEGWLTEAAGQISRLQSPNCDRGRNGNSVDLLVIHYISLPSGDFSGTHIIKLFMNAIDIKAHPSFTDLEDLKVSSHFLIRRNGSIIQFVSTEDRAWHAGNSTFDGREKCNEFSVGIEMEGTGEVPFEEDQYAALVALSHALKARYPQTLNAVLGHEHIAPGRKFDPGPHFDWTKFKRAYQPDLQVATNRPLAFPPSA
ncbi:1,6-anhydro-N-acetylmuramyl-L-alanine amidase AmpD [Glaciimonas soli]|uniref:1,6-anhydro-N-acetylmuramyl-L-alanine amidase AmpD n=1 Tax=Glaciimonas soli TaxID=2590999 RepID=A0A843YR00_9BURK|nr:1,6-anhydro-N-acetylmuramyl-L-alanine amidase AmpD [Glaciimonas soli]MQR02189.1 1,6-anhydro-N-acetylmuramyl-L-alanine amidase AmpD [Glaciimonas soli]